MIVVIQGRIQDTLFGGVDAMTFVCHTHPRLLLPDHVSDNAILAATMTTPPLITGLVLGYQSVLW